MSNEHENPFSTEKLPKPTAARQREILAELRQVVTHSQEEAVKLEAEGNETGAELARILAAEAGAAVEKLAGELLGTRDDMTTKNVDLSAPSDISIPRLKR